VSDPINLSAVRDARTKPDAEFVRKDDFGRELFCFLLEYEMAGDDWVTEVWAYSMDDAKSRVAAMRESLVLCGQMYSRTNAHDHHG